MSKTAYYDETGAIIALFEKPLLDPSSYATKVEVDDDWKIPAPPTEQLWISVRVERASRLSACDWTQLTDCPLSPAKKKAWKKYRQALRDVTEQGDPSNIAWPNEPT